LGHAAGACNTNGCYNVFIGALSGFSNTTGNSNTFLGRDTGASNTIGSFNTFIGIVAGLCNTTGCLNTFLGYGAGYDNTSGVNNVLLGESAGACPNGLASITTQSNRIIIGNCDHTCAQIKIGWTVVSDCRDKHIHCRLDKGRGFLQGINPIVFSFKNRETNEITDIKKRYGFVAQEILELEGNEPILVGADNPDYLGLTTDYLIPIMINAINELSREVELLKSKNS
jgi:hypothetical protein